MTNKEIIHDLEALKTYFEEVSGGCAPMCLEEAIKIISEKNNKRGA